MFNCFAYIGSALSTIERKSAVMGLAASEDKDKYILLTSMAMRHIGSQIVARHLYLLSYEQVSLHWFHCYQQKRYQSGGQKRNHSSVVSVLHNKWFTSCSYSLYFYMAYSYEQRAEVNVIECINIQQLHWLRHIVGMEDDVPKIQALMRKLANAGEEDDCISYWRWSAKSRDD